MNATISIGTLLALLLLGLAVFALVRYVLVPYVRLTVRRSRARTTAPEAGQVWAMDNGVLYVVAVDTNGVKLMYTDGDGKVTTFFDPWQRWHARLQNRVVWYTGRKQPLQTASDGM